MATSPRAMPLLYSSFTAYRATLSLSAPAVPSLSPLYLARPPPASPSPRSFLLTVRSMPRCSLGDPPPLPRPRAAAANRPFNCKFSSEIVCTPCETPLASADRDCSSDNKLSRTWRKSASCCVNNSWCCCVFLCRCRHILRPLPLFAYLLCEHSSVLLQRLCTALRC
jgi:hypothetical protein